ncbi:ion transporter [Henriciella litoralis]|uniref:ion transporter n=1 Tax=Henriciella litoralis TaxID=568102 RepID=UPI000A045807|nr:ion transporter [Henriciella litoralis]
MARATLDERTSNSGFEAAIESSWFRNCVTTLIIINAIVLGVLTYRENINPLIVTVLEVLDRAITYAFVFEIALKLVVFRTQFFRSGWNWFDFTVVGISLVPGSQAFSVLRAMRVLRVLRLLHVVPMMKRITEALLKALPGMGAIVAVLALLTYVYAVMATNMYGNTETEEVLQLFGDLPSSAFSLFQVMTMDGWRFEVVQKVIDDGHPWAWLFFMSFIFIASFAVLNLFIALVVDALAAEQKAATEELIEDIEEDAEAAEEERDEIIRLLSDMKKDIEALKRAAEGRSASTP